MLLAGLAAMDKVTLYGNAATAPPPCTSPWPAWPRGRSRSTWRSAKVNVWDGHNYAWELAGVLGIRDTGSAVRAGLVHYNDRSDVDRLLAAVRRTGRLNCPAHCPA